APPVTAPEASVERGRYGVRSYDADGELLRADTLRADGTLICRELPVMTPDGKRRQQQFFAPDGSPSVLLGSAWGVYYLWLDHLIGEDDAVIVNESKSTARFMSRYQHPRTSLLHLFHESHLAHEAGDDPFKGELGSAHRRVLPHLDRFDGVVFLTQRQRDDVAARFGGAVNLHSIPNAGPPVIELPRKRFDASRRDNRGIVVATLKPLKRLDHAVRAIAGVRAAGRQVSLDLYGRDGGSRAAIEAAVAETGTSEVVKLHGYTTDAARLFAGASFSLMTSLTEGQSLVLLESMAAGCVPISYDIRYGPSEIIVDGETGFLVPPGDLDALTETITRFLRLSGRRLRRLRAQCQERLSAFSDAEVYERWCAVEHAAIAQARRRISLTAYDVEDVAVHAEPDGFGIEVTLAACWDVERWTAPEPPTPTAALLLTGRRHGAPRRVAMELKALGAPSSPAPPSRFRATVRVDPRAAGLSERTTDVSVELSCEATSRRARLRGPIAARAAGHEIFATGYGNLSLRPA
ncbi:MAG TPA: glycosyltransferase, partial [Microlunatus sp.]|nr:glycosyltransferase [Microlunatus sp.]